LEVGLEDCLGRNNFEYTHFLFCYNMLMNIYLATDHAGFERKETIKRYVMELGFAVHDCGALVYDEGDDYPDFIKKAAEAVSNNPQKSLAIIFGGSGQGEAMVANRYPHVRATVYYGGNTKIVELSREHNHANVLSIGARFVDDNEARAVVRAWLLGHYTLAPRHKRRIEKLEGVSERVAYLMLAQERAKIGKILKKTYRRFGDRIRAWKKKIFSQ
jgi:ribose 5-phosphate isomerase B